MCSWYVCPIKAKEAVVDDDVAAVDKGPAQSEQVHTQQQQPPRAEKRPRQDHRDFRGQNLSWGHFATAGAYNAALRTGWMNKMVALIAAVQAKDQSRYEYLCEQSLNCV
jgi:hypothetical protein